MAVTERWKKLVSELALKGQGSPVAVTYVGLADSTFNAEASPVLGEISGTNYGRVPVLWTDFVDDMSNTSAVSWSVVGTWPQIRNVFLSDSSQGGEVLMWVGSVFTPDDGDVISIAIGDLILT